MAKGLRISLLGPDGIGKTTLTDGLRRWFEARGSRVEIVSWRRLIDGRPARSPYPQTALEQLWVEDWRLLYGGGSAGGHVMDDRIPRSFADFAALHAERTFPRGADDVSSAGPLASGLVEVAADFVIEAEVVRPLVAEGAVVIRESFGYKPVLKALLIAAECRRATVPRAVVERVIEHVTTMYADPFLQPDIGILLDGAATTAHERRSRDAGGVGIAESYALSGTDGPDSFVSLQQDCARLFATAARAWGWYELAIGKRGPDELCAEVIDRVLFPWWQEAVG